MNKSTLREVCEQKGLNGDGAFAIAAALFDLSDSQEATAKALQRLGLGNASTPFGAIENLAMRLETAGNATSMALDGIAQAIANSSEANN